MLERPPASIFEPIWLEIQGEPRSVLPSFPELVVTLLARGHLPEVRVSERGVMSYGSVEDAITSARRQLWTQPGREKDVRMESLMRSRLEEKDGRYSFAWAPMRIGVATWTPGNRR
jgi:hypothetical protein